MNRKIDRCVFWFTIVVLVVVLILIARVYGSAGRPGRGSSDERSRIPGYPAGEFREPASAIYTSLDGQEVLLLPHLWAPGKTLEAPVVALRLVNPRAPVTARGRCGGRTATSVARKMPRNRRFLPSAPRKACSAFTSYVLRTCGMRGLSFAVNTQYAQVRRRGGKVVASRVSTRYAPYFAFYKPGDLLFFHRGKRLGHEEIYVGNGLTAGTSSSMLRVAIRRVGNRGFAYMSVVRL